MSDISQLFASAMMHQMSLQEQQAQHAEQSRQFEQTLALQKEREREESVYRGKTLDLQERMRTDALNEQKLQRAMQEYEMYDPNDPIGKYIGDAGMTPEAYASIAGKNYDASQFAGKRYASRSQMQMALHKLDADERERLLAKRMGDEMKPIEAFNQFFAENVNPIATGKQTVTGQIDVPVEDNTTAFGITSGLGFNPASLFLPKQTEKKNVSMEVPEQHVARAYLDRLGKLHGDILGMANKSSLTQTQLDKIYSSLDAVLERTAGQGGALNFASNFGQYGYDLSPQAGMMMASYIPWKRNMMAAYSKQGNQETDELIKRAILIQTLREKNQSNLDKGAPQFDSSMLLTP